MTKRLLVTDDAIIIREMIKDTASRAGWEIVGEACNGQQAFEKFRELKPDAMTLDLVMPEFDGLHALRSILGEDPSAKIVVVSALDQKTILKEAFKLGAADFVVKPFDHGQLVATLNRVTGVC
ncbi:Chemotaxis protein CheY [Anatilimnocola aggregata]|uniref:Chemotaxis protein CheY n=1 Tax=Anatilimnocola aggregata TaxID=2528021 RepID=A0A517YK27_9BACT|nr:response regulator [Anatilimnocola aggregata]QDU30574.1 Chemotaxis protein CheY [Anatilimnocola aggregata]